jgi:hypothetical protein
MTEILLKMALNTIILILFVNITEIADEGCYRSGSCALSKIYIYIVTCHWVDTSTTKKDKNHGGKRMLLGMSYEHLY